MRSSRAAARARVTAKAPSTARAFKPPARKPPPKKSPARESQTKESPAGESPARRKRRARRIAELLSAAYPDARCMLDHRSPFELLVATILAAQCTDERVNQVTPILFARFPTPEALAAADTAELESIVRSTGFFRAKARSIHGAAEGLASRFPGRFPSTMEDLVSLPGVGRKTANVVLGVCFKAPAIIVDTHVRRVAGERLARADSDDPDEMERQLQPLLPESEWTRFSNSVTFHGRRCCHARKPDCPACPVSTLCPWPNKTGAGARKR